MPEQIPIYLIKHPCLCSVDQDTYGRSVSEPGVKMEMDDNEIRIEMENNKTKEDRSYPLTVG